MSDCYIKLYVYINTCIIICTFNFGYCAGLIDYGFKPSTYLPVIFPAGVTSVSFDIPIIDDRVLENRETFNISIYPISLPYGVILISPEKAVVTIVDNDSKFTIIISFSH